MIGQCGDNNAAIDLVTFEGQFPDSDGLREHAFTLNYAAQNIQEVAVQNSVTWSSLQNAGVYSAPGQEIVYSAMVPVTNASDGLVEAVEEVVTAVKTYADTAAEIKTRYLNGAKPEAQGFLQAISGDPEWDGKHELTDLQDRIMEILADLSRELEAAQRACANALGGIWSGKTYGAADESGEAAAGEIAYGLTEDAYDAAIEADLLPWAVNAEWNYTGIKKGFFQGIIMGVGDEVEEAVGWAGSMVFLRGWDKAKAAWGGMFDLVYTVGVATSISTAFLPIGWEAQRKLWDMGKDTLELDTWETDPARAAGRNIASIITIAIPGGAAVKAGKASRLAPAARHHPDIHGLPDGTGQRGVKGDPSVDGVDYNVMPDSPEAPPNWFGEQTPLPDIVTAVPPELPADETGVEDSGTDDQSDVPEQSNPNGPGRDPAMQPRLGDSEHGPGLWVDQWSDPRGRDYQKHITGVDLVDGRVPEYVMEYDHTDLDTGEVSRRSIKIDGFHWEKDQPPVQVYQEGKGRYEWMETRFKDPSIYQSTLRNMVRGQFRNQVDAMLQSGGNTRLEWHFMEQKVADDFFDLVASDERYEELLNTGRIVIKWTPMP